MIDGASIFNLVAGALLWAVRISLRTAVVGIGIGAGILILLLLSSIGVMNAATEELLERRKARRMTAALRSTASRMATARF